MSSTLMDAPVNRKPVNRSGAAFDTGGKRAPPMCVVGDSPWQGGVKRMAYEAAASLMALAVHCL